MPQPYSYQSNIADPFTSAVQGLHLGRSLEDMQAEREQRQMQALALRQKMAQAEQEMAVQRQMQTDLQGLASKGGNASGADYARVISLYPQLSEHFKRGWEILSPEQREAKVGNASRVLSAISTKNYKIAIDDLREQSEAAHNSGREPEAKAAEAMIRAIEANPIAAQQMIEMQLVSAQGPEKFTENFGKLKMLPEEIADTRSQIEARKQGTALDWAKLEQQKREATLRPSGMDKLTDAQRNAINAASEGSSDAQSAADDLEALAVRFGALGSSYGALSKGSEALKKLSGNEDYATELKKNYLRMRNSEAVKMLPKGPASDKDIAMAMEGFLPENANPSTVASFLRGMAKLRRYEAASLYAKAEWHSNVGHLGKAPDDFVLDGITIPAGTTYINFAKDYLKAKKREIEGKKETPREALAAPAPAAKPQNTNKPKNARAMPALPANELDALAQYGVKI